MSNTNVRSVLFLATFAANVLAISIATSSASAQCLEWKSGFNSPGTNASVADAVVFDDGSGPALYLGGQFTAAGAVPANRVARWNGSTFTALGAGLGSSVFDEVRALAAYDDGHGLALYAAGFFQLGQGLKHIAHWNGSSWVAVGTGLDGAAGALAVFDDGSGPALYVGGSVTTASPGPAINIARWNGTVWSSVGGGFDGHVWKLAVLDLGSGPALYASGDFTMSGGTAVNHIARWNGTSWTPLGTGLDSHTVSLGAFDLTGGGVDLLAGGPLLLSGVSVELARWDGTNWSAVSVPFANSAISTFLPHDDGSGPALYVGGSFALSGNFGVVRWNGTTWSSVGTGLDTSVVALSVLDSGSGPKLYAAGLDRGLFQDTTPGATTNDVGIARLVGTTWTTLQSGAPLMGITRAVQSFDAGSGPRLYAGGSFAIAGDVAAACIASFDGQRWSPLGPGVSSTILDDGSTNNAVVDVLALHSDASGTALYVGGNFRRAGIVTSQNILRWDGSAWSALGAGLGFTTNEVLALASFDDPSQGLPVLVAGGSIQYPAPWIMQWNGSTWSVLGSGVNGTVRALAVLPNTGAGPRLIAGGEFTTAGGASANRVAQWDGASWAPMGIGLNGTVRALAVFDDFIGSKIYAGGDFPGHLAVYDSGLWSIVTNSPDGSVDVLRVFDDGTGSGPALYVGGQFHHAGGMPASSIARFDGAQWSTLGSGLAIAGSASTASVYALAPCSAGAAGSATPDLYVAGIFNVAGGVASDFIAAWKGCGGLGVPFCFGDGSGAACPCGNNGASGNGCANALNAAGANLASIGTASISNDTFVLSGSGMTNGSALYFQGTSALGGGNGVAFGDGLRCAGGASARLGTKVNVGQASQYPSAGDLPVSVRGGVTTPGAVRTYQIWYRNALPFCTPSTFDLSNALRAVWLP